MRNLFFLYSIILIFGCSYKKKSNIEHIHLNQEKPKDTISIINSISLDENYNFIIGKWKEIEYHGNDGANDYVNKIENGQTITFEKNGNAVIEKDNILDKGKYEVLHHNKYNDKLHISSSKRELYYLISDHESQYLTLIPVTSEYQFICKEGCAYVYKKID